MSTTRMAEPISTTDLKLDLELLRQDVRELKADLQCLLQDSTAVGRNRAEQAKDRLIQEMNEIKQKSRETIEMVRDDLGEHPFATLAAAFAAGAVVGLFVPRRG